MNAIAKILAMIVIVAGCFAGCKQEDAAPRRQSAGAPADAALVPTTATTPARVEWKLPSGLASIRFNAIDISSDRKLAVLWSAKNEGTETKGHIWLVDLETGRTDDLLGKIGGDNAVKLAFVRSALFSPDGSHIAVLADKHVGIVDPFTGKTTLISTPTWAGIAWGGNRLLLSRWDSQRASYGRIEAYDMTGKQVEPLNVYGGILASDSSGQKLLVNTNKKDPTKPWNREDETVAVVTPEGKMLREVATGGGICDRDSPLLSRQGNFAGAYCANSPKGANWCRRIDPIGSGDSIFLETSWGGTSAISETGGCLSFERRSNERAVLCFWTRDGKRHEMAESPIAGTILGDEVFFIQGDSKAATLRAIPIPMSGPGVASQPMFRDRDS